MTCNGLIVFSDVDGTLLDHNTYDWSAAKPALEALRRGGHCLVLASSKTAAEINSLRSAISFECCPAIVENGSGILPPGETAEIKGETYQQLLAALADMPKNLRAGFSGFSDWSIEEISEQTSLSPDDATKAAARQFSEPGLWSGSDSEFEQFCNCLKRHTIKVQRGGRFITLSFGGTKIEAMRTIVDSYRAREQGLKVVALGDAPNDIAMLQAADYGFIIANRSHPGIGKLNGEKNGQIVRSREFGPLGWNECVFSVINATESK